MQSTFGASNPVVRTLTFARYGNLPSRNSRIVASRSARFVMPFTSDMCTRDPECKKIIDNDSLEHKFATPRLLQSILLGQISSILSKHKIRTDTLFLLAGDDTFVSSKASKSIFKVIKFEHKEMIEYPEMRHSLTMELGREKVFADLLKWLEKRI